MSKLTKFLVYLANATILFLFIIFIFSCEADDDPAFPAGKANFTPEDSKILVGDNIGFRDESSGSVSTRAWKLDGGTPATSVQLNPTIVYNQPGTFDVTLTATDFQGDVTTKTGTVEVLVEETADFMADNTSPETNSEVVFTAIPSGLATDRTWNWTFEGGTPATSTEPIVTVTYALPGNFDVSLTVSNGLSTDIEFKEEYVNAVLASDGFLCLPQETTGSDGTSSSFTYNEDAQWERIDEFSGGNLLSYLFAKYVTGDKDLVEKIERFNADDNLQSTETYLYNENDLVSRYSFFDEAGSPQFFSDYSYVAGTVNPSTSITQQSNGLGGFNAFDVIYVYDDNKNIKLETFNFFGTNNLALTVEYEYDDKNNPFNGLFLSPPPIADNINNITSIITKDSGGNVVDSKTFEFTYNDQGYPITTKQTNLDLSIVTFTNTYQCEND